MVTALSFFWMVVNCCVMSLLIYMLRTRTEFISKYGFSGVRFLIDSCMIRLLIPLEIPGFRYSSVDVFFSSDTEKLVYSTVESFLSGEFLPYLIIFWICGSVCQGTRLYLHTRKTLIHIKNNSYDAHSHVIDILKKIDGDCPATIRICPRISRSCLTGYFHLNIYLPEYPYTDEELYYIFLHEYSHWKRKDIWKKALMNIWCIVAWWNPAIHSMRREVSQLLEFECDKFLAKNLTDEEVMGYLDTLLICIRNAQTSFLDRSLDNFVTFNGSPKVYMSKHRFKLLIDRDSEDRRKIFPKASLILFGLIWLLSSYYFIPRANSFVSRGIYILLSLHGR